MDKVSTPQHKHCPVCGKSMESSRDICSEECESAVAARRKSQRRMTWIMFGIIGIILAFFWILMPLFLVMKPGGR